MRRVKIFNKKEDAKNARGREMGGFLSWKNRCILPVAEDQTAFLRLNFREVPMFDSLDDQMRKDEDKVSSSKGRMMFWALVIIGAGIVFGGLIIGVHYMS